MIIGCDYQHCKNNLFSGTPLEYRSVNAHNAISYTFICFSTIKKCQMQKKCIYTWKHTTYALLCLE